MSKQSGKQTTVKRRTNRPRSGLRNQGRRSAAQKQKTFGLRLLLIGILLIMGVWVLSRVPPGQVILGTITILLVILLFMAIWFLRRFCLTPEEKRELAEQRMEMVQMEVTAQAIGIRSIEREDLAYLGDKEFEQLTGVLLEAMRVGTELEIVGGARDRGIDLRGKNKHGLLLIVQCKRYFGSKGNNKVLPKETREFRGTMGLHGAREAWFVTTSFFTDQARADVEHLVHRGDMALVDGKQLETFIRKYWDALPPQWQWRLTECMVARDRQRRAD